MKKEVRNAIIGIGLGIIALGANSFGFQCDKENAKKALQKALPGLQLVQPVSTKEKNGLCQVIIGMNGTTNYFPVYIGGSDDNPFVITGMMWQNKTPIAKEDIENLQTEAIREHLKMLDKLAGIYVNNNAPHNRTIYFITDPQCPFCEEVKKSFLDMAKSMKWNVKLVWLPLQTPRGSLHPGSKKIVEHFICDNATIKDYLSNKYNKSSKDICKKGIEETENNIKALSFIQGTPTFIFDNGKIVMGANIPLLARYMAEGEHDNTSSK
ncbi:MAG TPA: hypothetical protein ENO30_04485 [Thermodesulfobium narugense]|nr:hypothetical protein [Thermodesulfobium narugense]